MLRWRVIKVDKDNTEYLLRMSTDILAYMNRYKEIMNDKKPWSLSKESREFYIDNLLRKRLVLLERYD